MSAAPTDGASTVSGVEPGGDTGPAPPAAVPRRPRPGALDISIHRRGAVIELGLSGELDMATAPRLGEAMAWLRWSCGPTTTIVIDTSNVDFIAAAGYRAVQMALVRSDGLWDPHVTLIVGRALARLEAAISGARDRSCRPSRKP